MHEQDVEAKLDGDSGCGRFPFAEAGLPLLLARLRRLVEFGRVGIPNFRRVSVTDYGSVSGACRWSVGIPGPSAARIRTFRARSVCGCRGAGQQVLVGIKSCDVRGNRIIGSRLDVECVVASSSCAGLLCGKPSQLKEKAWQRKLKCSAQDALCVTKLLRW